MEWLVTVKVLKIDNSWSYNSCKKCLKTSKVHGDTYKCSNRQCAYIGAPNPRYKLEMIAGDETGDTEFILFGRTAQRIIKKSVDDLIADNPVGFIPDDITRLLEKVYMFNVSFTENTITSGNVSFQVNAVVAEIDDGNPLLVTPAGSQSSSIMLTQGASSSMQGNPLKGATFSLPSPAAPSEASHASSTTSYKAGLPNLEPPVTPQSRRNPYKEKGTQHKDEGDAAAAHAEVEPTALPVLQTQKSATKKRACESPNKRTVKKLFANQEDSGNDARDGSASAAAKPREGGDDA